MPEVRHYCPSTPVVLVGMKGDLRDGGSSTDRSHQFVDLGAAQELAKEIGEDKGLYIYISTWCGVVATLYRILVHLTHTLSQRQSDGII